jgi:hypothetical protein
MLGDHEVVWENYTDKCGLNQQNRSLANKEEGEWWVISD